MTAFARSVSFVIPQNASVSNGISFSATAQPLILVGLRVPVTEATTTQLAVQVSFDNDSVVDGSATWLDVFSGSTQLRATTTAGTARYCEVQGASAYPLPRVRLVATTDANAAVSQATAARTVVPVWATYST